MIQESTELANEGLSVGVYAFRFAMAVGLVLANGFFVGSEFALVSVRRSRVEMLAETGNKGAQTVLRVLDNMGSLISATQLGITLSSLALGWIGEEAVAHLLEPVFARVLPPDWHAAAGATVSVVIGFVVITYMHIVLGELMPKTVSLEKAELVSLWVARPMEIFYTVFKAPIWLLNKSANILGRIVGLEGNSEHAATIYSEEELRYLIDISHKGGQLNAGERELIHNVFEFAEGTVRDSMIPRTEITVASANAELSQVVTLFETTGYSRIPVAEADMETVIGVLHGKDVLMAALRNKPVTIRELVRPVLFVPPSAQLDHVLARMKRTGNHMAIVVDEHGGLEGVVTLEDILEEIVGEIRDEFDEGEVDPVTAQEDGSFLIDAATAIRAVNRKLGLRIPESNRYSTLAGFLLAEAGAIPKQGQVIPFGSSQFVVENVRRHRVVSVRFIPGEAPTPQGQEALEA
jgi:CBS domain containing-hemolysin-like protein